MATPKQLAALKKARAARAKKKKPVTAKSQITGKAPSARLKKRRVANTKKGYFPNPLTTKDDLEKAKAIVAKARAKKAAASTRPKSYIVKVTKHSGTVGYYVSDYPRGKFDTDISLASPLTLVNANKLARGIFADFNRAIYKVEVLKK
jgi:hypothetical protein